MLFRSAEIRWFSKDKNLLWNIYTKLSKTGVGIKEDERTDYYLLTNLKNSGIKIREGNHEIKVKSAKDQKTSFGTIEHWVKWSTPEGNNIMNTIQHGLLDEWIGISKNRYKKKFEIVGPNEIRPTTREMVKAGCGIEYTELRISGFDQPIFTLGFEAFGIDHEPNQVLETTIEKLGIDLSILMELDSYGYPEFITRLNTFLP